MALLAIDSFQLQELTKGEFALSPSRRQKVHKMMLPRKASGTVQAQ